MKNCRSQSGVALVITLILLSVITIIAVAFLALTQRERASLSQTLIGTEAEAMASTALERAKSQILAEMALFLETNMMTNIAFNPPIITHRLALGPDFSVSVAAPYTYTNPPNMAVADYQVLTNLLYDAPPPVFSTNRNGTSEHVHYLDLNRNGRFEPSGVVPDLDDNGNVIPNQFHDAVGDPQWIGVTARPNEPHSGTNRFGGRFAFVIVPAGRTLDIDFIHNRARNNLFNRNQGHGSWELNLAAFLSDLNPDVWRNYLYANRGGLGFQDARQILDYRYGGPGRDLLPAYRVFDPGVVAYRADAWQGDGIDQYADGADRDARLWWSGSPNPNHFFSVHEFFNNPPIGGFSANLMRAGAGRVPGGSNSFNSETFYRMLAQLGTDTVPEKRSYFITNEAVANLREKGPINLNYVNLKYTPANEITAAEFVPWTPEEFFHVVADRLLRDHQVFLNNNPLTPLSVTNLPVYPTNYYTPSVHRILQMTLNIFDATTNHGASYPYYPTVLKPVFEGSANFVRIVGYERVPQDSFVITNFVNWKDLSNQTDRASLQPTQPHQYVYGVPVLIGAKKGFPNFNEFSLQSIVQVSRKVNVQKENNNRVTTNHVFYMSITNFLGVEAWNSYTNTFPRELEMVSAVELSTSLSITQRPAPIRMSVPDPFQIVSRRIISNNTWRGESFRIPVTRPREEGAWAGEGFLPLSAYDYNNNTFVFSNFHRATFPTPGFVLTNKTRLRFFLFDNGHLVDAVGLAPADVTIDITKALHDMGDNDPGDGSTLFWRTSRGGGPAGDIRAPTDGILEQMEWSWNTLKPQFSTTGTFADPRRVQEERSGFLTFLNGMSTNPVGASMWAPYTPQQRIYKEFTWQANDPLVHYLADDLRLDTNSAISYSPLNNPSLGLRTIGNKNAAYSPWNHLPNDTNSVNPAVRDPMVTRSDDWDFPTNKVPGKFPTVGALGRIHRGTPWQTIYFKFPAVDPVVWRKNHAGGARSVPTNDWRLADIFTVAQHPNQTRGRLSVNQTNLAAWSALFSGIEVPVLTGSSAAPRVNTNIFQPLQLQPELARIHEAIYTNRAAMTGQVFSSVSEFLSVPELTVGSPFLNPPFAPVVRNADNPLTDRHYERIPEAIASLVKPGEPRFVIYAFGQSLRPAPQSVLTGGPYRGLCVNYEVTGELAARAVVRVELEPRQGLPPAPRAIVESFNILPPD